ncbi:MAG: glycosyltransferase family 4 protein [Bacteroidota bacterium]
MKILFISHKFPPAIGGMERHAYELHSRLSQQHELIDLIYDNQEGRFRFFRKLQSRIRAIFQEHSDIDLVYVNEGLLASFVAPIKKWTKAKIIATVHGLDVVFPNRWYQRFIQKRLNLLDGLIAVSKATAEACQVRSIRVGKTFVVNNGVDHELAYVPKDEHFLAHFQQKHRIDLGQKKILVTMGRPVSRKGFSWFTKQVLPFLDADTILFIIGPNNNKTPALFQYLPPSLQKQLAILFSMESDAVNLAAAVQLPANKNRVFQLGKLPFPEVQQLLQCADLFVMPNRRIEGDMEGFGLVALEAAIMGTPVVASGIEGITNAIQDGQNGYLLPVEQPSVWVETIHDILQQPAALRQFSQQVQQYTLAHFGWSEMAGAYGEVFENVAKSSSLTHH